MGFHCAEIPKLANVFYRLELIEPMGQAYKKIMDAYKK